MAHELIAYIATTGAILHSILFLSTDTKVNEHSCKSEFPYWYWGIVAALAMYLLIPTSGLWIRQTLYEFFLGWHIAFSAFTLGYETWIYVAIAVWGFNRITRLLRALRNGIKMACIIPIDDRYVKVESSDAEFVKPGGHAYLYFPTLTWRIWESHPFFRYLDGSTRTSSTIDIEKSKPTGSASPISDSTSGANKPHRVIGHSPQHKAPYTSPPITFYIRKKSGLTASLAFHCTLPVLIESTYGICTPIPPSSTLLCIAGGVGITAHQPLLAAHPGPKKLFWGARSEALVRAVQPVLGLADGEIEVALGRRLDLRVLLEEELGDGSKYGYGRGGERASRHGG
ncbi:hypothetical protein BDY21DRAFT_417194 [Lineolata rhizophorae]|uniref:Ferric oxidoreductase domain-containing protein n=1 Tax=Lineolata rhizophorae TaxID=578093 RepID=A0A6A6NPS5_9PEZI|nr:hypothetical protein BDY21DRAFT_417194 [Lineolata rhizophorae]